MPSVVIACELSARDRDAVVQQLAGIAEPVFLSELDEARRASALRDADAVMAHSTRELRPAELPLLRGKKLLQFFTAGIDHVPLADVPEGVPVACNGGAYAEPMAEHAMAMALAAAKRLLVEHAELAKGNFNQFARNRMLASGVCGILGFGGIGVAVARLARAFGMRVHAINRRGSSDQPVDWIATPDRLDELLAGSDLLVICTPLTPATNGLIGAAQLARMKPDAILVNVARGEIIDEAALFAHLHAHPGFVACLDAWWVEPIRHGSFRVEHDFLSLPNVIGSPHNSAAAIAAANPAGLRHALDNVKRVLTGIAPLHLVEKRDRMM